MSNIYFAFDHIGRDNVIKVKILALVLWRYYRSVCRHQSHWHLNKVILKRPFWASFRLFSVPQCIQQQKCDKYPVRGTWRDLNSRPLRKEFHSLTAELGVLFTLLCKLKILKKLPHILRVFKSQQKRFTYHILYEYMKYNLVK